MHELIQIVKCNTFTNKVCVFYFIHSYNFKSKNLVEQRSMGAEVEKEGEIKSNIHGGVRNPTQFEQGFFFR